MAKIVEGGRRTEYDSYEEYKNIQNARAHEYDSTVSIDWNVELLGLLSSHGHQYKSILDVGCRSAAYFDQMERKGVSCVGIDISKTSIEYAKSKGRNVLLGDAENLESLVPGTFDVVISCHSLEHFLNAEKVVASCVQKLSPIGFLIIRVPDEGPVVTNADQSFAHVRTFTLDELRELAEQNDLRIVECKKVKTDLILLAQRQN